MDSDDDDSNVMMVVHECMRVRNALREKSKMK